MFGKTRRFPAQAEPNSPSAGTPAVAPWGMTHALDTVTPTPLLDLPGLARLAGVGRVLVKDESRRALGAFKSLGGVNAGLKALERAGPGTVRRLICASEGNHGLAVAEAARQAGAQARIYLSAQVSAARSGRIAALGAEIVRVEGSFDAAVNAAHAAAGRGEGLLIPDTSEDSDDPVVRDVMDGYKRLAHELPGQFAAADAWPSHALVQAGVGGLAGAVAEGLAEIMADHPRFTVVEPQTAACVAAALAAGRPVQLDSELQTCASMLACGLASTPALQVLLRYGATAISVDEPGLLAAPETLFRAGGPATTPSGAAGLAGLLAAAAAPELRARLSLAADSRVLLIVSEAVPPRG